MFVHIVQSSSQDIKGFTKKIILINSQMWLNLLVDGSDSFLFSCTLQPDILQCEAFLKIQLNLCVIKASSFTVRGSQKDCLQARLHSPTLNVYNIYHIR
jgi:hypothetical protein